MFSVQRFFLCGNFFSFVYKKRFQNRLKKELIRIDELTYRYLYLKKLERGVFLSSNFESLNKIKSKELNQFSLKTHLERIKRLRENLINHIKDNQLERISDYLVYITRNKKSVKNEILFNYKRLIEHE